MSPKVDISPGDLVVTLDGSLFILSQGGWRIYADHSFDHPVGLFAPHTYGLVLDVTIFEKRNSLGSLADVLVFCPGGIGWIWIENVKKVAESPDKFKFDKSPFDTKIDDR